MHRLIYGLTRNDTRSDFFNRRSFFSVNRAFTINWLTQGIHDTANQLTTNRHFQNTAGTFNLIAFFNVLVFTQYNRTNRITLQVHGQTERVAGELQHLTLHDIRQAVHTHNTVGNRNHAPIGTGFLFYIQVFNFRF